jgi:hypothetical protein
MLAITSWLFVYAKERFEIFPVSAHSPAHLRGKIIHEGRAVSGVTVRLAPVGELGGLSRIYTKERLTDLNGLFFFEKLLPGTYKITVGPSISVFNRPSRLEEQITLREAETEYIELRLE